MINNFHDQLRNFYSNRGKTTDSGGAADVMRRLRERRDAVRNGGQPAAEAATTDEAAAQEAPAAATKRKRPNYAKAFEDSKNPEKKKAAEQKAADEADLSPHEKRQKALQEIMDRLDAEEAAKYPNRVKKDKTDAAANVTTTTNPEDASKVSGIENFLNDMPLFNEFKSSLVDAFKSLDGATSGSISAQYELNYTSMQYIAAENGDFEYKETTLNIKLDLNYVKAAAGGSTKEIASAIENAKDFESLMSSLQEIASKPGTTPEQAAEQTKGMPEFKGLKPEDFLSGMKDYFGPEATSGRIVDFATMYFPMSKEYKEGGDTEEARKAYSDRMGKAIQKGFDQAIGTLGAVPKDVMDGINKTHELTFKGLEDFVKNGMSKQKQDEGVYDSLEKFAFSFEMNYSQTSVKYNTYDSRGQTQSSGKTPSVNTEA